MPGIDSYTKLLLHMDGEHSGSDHNVILNAGAVLDSTTKKFGVSSMRVDGAGGYLSTSSHTDFDLRTYTESWTIDFWAKLVDDNSIQSLVSIGSAHFGSLIIIVNSDVPSFMCSDDSVSWTTTIGTGTVSYGQWQHWAVVNNAGTVKIYLDGEEKGSGILDANIVLNNYIVKAGEHYSLSSGYEANGNIDELRISKGIARWTTGFDPPTSSYTTDSYTKLLVHFAGDESGSKHDTMFYGDGALSRTQYKWKGSYYMDGTGAYALVPNSSDWEFGSGDFTVDWWEYRTAVGGYGAPVARDAVTVWAPWAFGYDDSSTGNVDIYITSNGSAWDIALGKILGPRNLNTWTHRAVVRSGDTFYAFTDGEIADTWTLGSSLSILANSNPLSIGRWQNANQTFFGYMDELRISKGIARWTSAFTPPKTPYSDHYITGDLNDGAQIISIDENSWEVDASAHYSTGSYEMDTASGTKLIAARNTHGEIIGYGNVNPTT